MYLKISPIVSIKQYLIALVIIDPACQIWFDSYDDKYGWHFH
jgi:hypothetical protein